MYLVTGRKCGAANMTARNGGNTQHCLSAQRRRFRFHRCFAMDGPTLLKLPAATQTTPMGNLANWTELENSGALPRSPGREEAIAATMARTAAKKAAEKAKTTKAAK